MMIMQKCIGINNLFQSKILILKAQWFRNFETLAKSRIFMKKKKENQTEQFVEVNDGVMRTSRKMRRNQGSAFHSVRRTFSRKQRFAKTRKNFNRQGQGAVPRDISRLYQMFIGNVFIKLQSFFKLKNRKIMKQTVSNIKTFSKRFYQRKNRKIMSQEEKRKKMNNFFLLIKCKLIEKKSNVLFYFYKKFVLLRPFGNIVCRNLVKINKWKMQLSFEKLIKNKRDLINQEYKVKYGIESLHRIFLNLSNKVFGQIRSLCK